MFDIKENLKMLPDKPGVYLYKDKFGEIIYVGKALSLKKRVRQYFQSPENLPAKVRALVENIDEFEYIITGSEMEALILENNLIKKNMPRYNVLLRDDKTYPYIKVTLNEDYPRVIKTRRVVNDGGKYFGPYTDVGSVNQIIDFLNKVYPVKKCSAQSFPRNFRPCLNYHIGLCRGVCCDNISRPEYREMVDEIIAFLQGNSADTEKMLEKKMQAASEAFEFEQAAEYRDGLMAVRMLREKQKIVTNPKNEMDIIVSADVDEGTNIMLFFVRNGKMTGRESFRINPTIEQSREEKVAAFIKQYYCEKSLIPKEILVESMNEEFDIIGKWISEIKGSSVNIHVPEKGEKKALLDMAAENISQTRETFEKRVKNEKDKTVRLEEALSEMLKIEGRIRRIEAYDISNISGVDSVGVMVVFENGKKQPRDYRKFKIKTIEGPNDYGSLQEVIYRRFRKYFDAHETGQNNGFEKKPDLLLIDGGEKQAAAVEMVVNAMNLDIPVVGMVKDDRHRTRDLVYREKLAGLKNDNELYKFIYFIQEEVHRFAIEYHRSLRSKSVSRSVLDEISGIGEKRRNLLLAHFGSVDRIKEAGTDELAKVEGMNRKAAEAVAEFFRNRDRSRRE
ncbi:MAG: excinuclease ABC subunit UvrC [Bacillota bacterium]|nr:excinuclease ABC subunit UvrC [Bacillota bacterium]